MKDNILLTFTISTYSKGMKDVLTIYVPKTKIIDFCITYEDSIGYTSVILDVEWAQERGIVDTITFTDYTGKPKAVKKTVKGELSVLKGLLEGSKAAKILYGESK